MVLTPVTLTTPTSVLGVIMRQPTDIMRMIGWADAIKFCVFLSDLLMLHKLLISASLHFKSLCFMF